MTEETFAALALTLTPGIGLQRLHRLLRESHSAVEVLRLSSSSLRRLRLPLEARASLRSGRSQKLAEGALEDAGNAGIELLSLYESSYPAILAEIYDPPVILYALGRIELLGLPAVALVGSRRCSVYGRQVARKLARELAALGLCIVSGLARGIDATAHRGALDSKGPTVAVLGSGVDVPYPRENLQLYEQIREQGCLLSEFPCGSYPAPQNFPVRNRIISGLCHGTIIGEGAEFSGSLITARLALEQNRELWAVPGNITSKGSYGPNYLIKQGAGPVLDSQDVLDNLPLHVLETLSSRQQETEPEAGPGECARELSDQERKLLDLLPVDEDRHLDELTERSGLSPPALSEMLLRLQLDGLVVQSPGSRYSRKLF